MELKKPADPWERPPDASRLNASKALASAIRINVNAGPETLPTKPASLAVQTNERLFVSPATRAQTPLPTRRQHDFGRQLLGT